MNRIDIQKRKTDLAWEQLYGRLDADGLLPVAASGQRQGVRIRAVSWAAAIAVLCVFAATMWIVTRTGAEPQELLSMQNNEIETTLITTLEDGSIVYLAENATLHYPVHFETESRKVALEGNAQFDVSGNRERPFYIDTKEVAVEVLGTSFHIRNQADIPFELTVEQGEVKVTVKESSEQCLVRAGERVQLLADGLLISFMDTFEPGGESNRRIRFKDEKLGNVLRVLNKQIGGATLETVAGLEERTFSVAFAENTSPDHIAEIICLGLKLQHRKEGDRILLLPQRQGSD